MPLLLRDGSRLLLGDLDLTLKFDSHISLGVNHPLSAPPPPASAHAVQGSGIVPQPNEISGIVPQPIGIHARDPLDDPLLPLPRQAGHELDGKPVYDAVAPAPGLKDSPRTIQRSRARCFPVRTSKGAPAVSVSSSVDPGSELHVLEVQAAERNAGVEVDRLDAMPKVQEGRTASCCGSLSTAQLVGLALLVVFVIATAVGAGILIGKFAIA